MKILILCLLLTCSTAAVFAQQKTYCNPVNIDYGYTPYESFTAWGRHRATADPVIVNYQGDFFLFSTNQGGYWHSPDLLNWTFHVRPFLRPWNNETKDDLCAPGVGIIGDTMVVFGSTYTSDFSLWGSTNPKNNEWFVLVDSFEIGGWDPAFFTDDDGRFYMYNGSSNRYPMYGVELDRRTFKPKGTRTPMYLLEDWRYGWQRFGEHNDNTFLDPFAEGAWMTKHNGRYYFQYGAPGTEFSGYSDGVVVGDSPLFNFTPTTPQSDPLSSKMGGFNRGAGHGATFQDNDGRYWHTATTIVCVKNTWERRIGIWPAGFDNDNMMWCNTAFGDYPMYLPAARTDENLRPDWWLLNYKKPVTVSSTFGGYTANNAVDENIKTYWSARSANKGEWIQTDLGQLSTVHAIQINYADQDAEFLGKQTGIFHQYELYASTDGQRWVLIVDKSKNKTDVPHDYIELEKPVQARFIKLVNVHTPTGKFAISGLRVFGNGNGPKPDKVKDLIVLRTEKDKRSAYIKWSPVDNAFAYTLYYGTELDKLYNSILIYDFNEYWFKAMDSQKTYYFAIEAVNENGTSGMGEVKKAD